MQTPRHINYPAPPQTTPHPPSSPRTAYLAATPPAFLAPISLGTISVASFPNSRGRTVAKERALHNDADYRIPVASRRRFRKGGRRSSSSPARNPRNGLRRLGAVFEWLWCAALEVR